LGINELSTNDGLYTTYTSGFRHLYALLLKILHSPEDAEDIVQDVFCKICEIEPREFYPPVESFLFKMVQNLAIDFQREEKNSVRRGIVSLETLSEEIPVKKSPENESQIKQFVESLPYDQRTTIQLHNFEDLTILETADALGLKEKMTDSLIRHGLNTLPENLLEYANPT